jgi:uncharacterized membrane protein (TIGR02234 family)
VTPRREYAVTLTVLAASGMVALIIAGQPWATIASPSPLGTQTLKASGTELTGAVRGVGLLSLAAVLAILATKGWPRRIIGMCLAVAGVLASLHLLQVSRDLTDIVTAWAEVGTTGVTVRATPAIWVAVVACLGVAAAGVLTAGRGHRWPELLAKHERRSETRAEDAWDVLDRGEDPTV